MARVEDMNTIFDLPMFTLSLNGFGFPFAKVSPPHVVGALSLGVLAVCLAARYWKQLQGGWRATYVITALMALYHNVSVLLVQLFARTPPLAQLAPTQQEAPFAVTQALVFALFVWIGWAGLRGFRMARAPGLGLWNEAKDGLT